MRHLGGMDTMFVRAETPSMLMHVTGVLTLDPGPMSGVEVRDRIRDLINARLPAIAPLQWRLVEPPGGVGALRWVEDPHFDVAEHIQLCPVEAPGTRAELERAAAAVAATPLDRRRPLWEMHLLEGMADGSIAVISKFHHAFMDGSAGMELVAALFDLSPDADVSPLEDHRVPEPIPSPWRLLADTPGDVLARARQVPTAVMSTLAGTVGLIGAMFPGRSPQGRRSMARRTPFNGALSEARKVALADCSLAEVREVKRAFGVTVNDVVLAAVTSSLRSELAGDGGPGGALIAAVPVALGGHCDHQEDQFGNHTSAMMVPLPVDVDDPVKRLQDLHRLCDQAKARHRAMGAELIERWATLVPPWMISSGARLASRCQLAAHLPPVFNLIVSNVAGPPVPVYLAGSEVTATYPLGPLIGGAGLNVTVISHRDRVHIGVIADPSLVEAPSRLAEGIAAGVAELLAMASSPASLLAADR